MLWKRLYFFLTILLISAGCSHSVKKYENVFYWNLYTGITSLDPAFARSQSNIWVVNQLFNGLVQLDDSMNVKPCIAKRWEINQEGTVYTFILKNDVYFHDDEAFTNGNGRKVTARDFVFSFYRIINPATASPGAWIFNDKVRKKEEGPAFEAVNDSVFRIYLQRSFPPFLSLLTTQYCSVVPQEAVNKYGKEFRAKPVGTGPFFVKYYIEGEKLILHKNPDYFESDTNGKKLPYLDAVDISFITSKQNEFFSFMQEKLDFISGIDQSYKDNLLTKEGELKEKFKGKLQFEKSPFLNTEYLGFLIDTSINNNKTSPLQLKKVRQAINYAVDRPKMIRYIRNNIGLPGEFGFVPPGLPPFSKASGKYYSYNPAKAKQLLKEAGFPEGKGIPEIKLATTANYLDLTIFVQKQLLEIGIPVTIENVPSSTLSEWKSQGKSAFFRGSWIADYPDPENYLAIFYSKNIPPAGPNYFHYTNLEYDKLYEKAIKLNDPAERNYIYIQMQEILMEDPPFLVLYYDEVVRLKSNRIKGLTPNPINLINLKKVSLLK